MIILFVILTTCMAIDSYRRISFSSASSIYTFFCAASIIVFCLFTKLIGSIDGFTFYNPVRSESGAIFACGMFTWSCFLAYLASFFGSNSRTVKVFNPSALTIPINRSRILVPIGVFLLLATFAHGWQLDWRLTWRGTDYAAYNDPLLMSVTNPLGRVYHTLMPLLLLGVGPLLIGIIKARRGGIALLYVIPFSYSLLYEVASNSRWGGLPLLGTAAFIFLLYGRKGTFPGILLILMGILLYVSALVGRAAPYHGISMIIANLGATLGGSAFGVLQLTIYTIFEGIFSTSRVGDYSPSYPLIYKLLSFSPFPSSIDGFNSVALKYEVRMRSYLPIGAWAEAFYFGAIYFAAWSCLILTFFLIDAYVSRAANGLLQKAVSISLLVEMAFSNTYQMRNTLRILLIFSTVQLVILAIRRREMRLRKQTRRIRGDPSFKP